MCFNPQVSLADSDEDRRLRDGVGAEVVQLRSVVLAQRSHESTDEDAESPLVNLLDNFYETFSIFYHSLHV